MNKDTPCYVTGCAPKLHQGHVVQTLALYLNGQTKCSRVWIVNAPHTGVKSMGSCTLMPECWLKPIAGPDLPGLEEPKDAEKPQEVHHERDDVRQL